MSKSQPNVGLGLARSGFCRKPNEIRFIDQVQTLGCLHLTIANTNYNSYRDEFIKPFVCPSQMSGPSICVCWVLTLVWTWFTTLSALEMQKFNNIIKIKIIINAVYVKLSHQADCRNWDVSFEQQQIRIPPFSLFLLHTNVSWAFEFLLYSFRIVRLSE